MELLDRETFLEWMERIMKRFDDLKQTTADIPQRPMIDGEPLLDNQEVCLMLQISKRTLQRYRASGTLPSTSFTTRRGIWNRKSLPLCKPTLRRTSNARGRGRPKTRNFGLYATAKPPFCRNDKSGAAV